VLLVHGFPETWYSWRHQLPAMAAAGYRAVAIDVRGYGRSSKPRAIEAYRMLAHVADNVAVVRALGATTATVIGHDWGSPIAATSALLRPDIFTAVGLLSVPYTLRSSVRPTDAFALAGGDEEFYVSYFQQAGRAEAEMETDVRSWLRGFYTGLSGNAAHGRNLFTIPHGGRMRDRLPDSDPLPRWLSEDDLDVYAQEFERTGLTGALNRYRNVDRDWEDLAAWDGAIIDQPAIFIGGEQDASTTWMADAIEAHGATLPKLRGSHLLDGCGHWVQQERAEDVSRLLIEWLD
jgi:pimeloyl-ACP methyl ester carboxylesterase